MSKRYIATQGTIHFTYGDKCCKRECIEADPSYIEDTCFEPNCSYECVRENHKSKISSTFKADEPCCYEFECGTYQPSRVYCDYCFSKVYFLTDQCANRQRFYFEKSRPNERSLNKIQLRLTKLIIHLEHSVTQI